MSLKPGHTWKSKSGRTLTYVGWKEGFEWNGSLEEMKSFWFGPDVQRGGGGFTASGRTGASRTK